MTESGILEDMERRSELGEFLRTRRARLRPEDVGLPDYGGRRRVPGLRREELAHLAGVSAGYYTRLEQGQSPNASHAVLDAIARVLQLEDAERSHLHSLAHHKPKARRRRRHEHLRPNARLMIGALGDVPAQGPISRAWSSWTRTPASCTPTGRARPGTPSPTCA